MIKRIEYIQNKYHIHRDIKPDNFMTGKDEKENKIYLIDFGLAKNIFLFQNNNILNFQLGNHLLDMQDIVLEIHIKVMNKVEEMILKILVMFYYIFC